MRFLLDTHVLLSVLGEPERIRPPVRQVLEDRENQVAVSAASAWEIGIKAALGRLRAPEDLAGELVREGLDALPITAEDGLAAGALPRHHDDPFDRMLVAQSRRHD